MLITVILAIIGLLILGSVGLAIFAPKGEAAPFVITAVVSVFVFVGVLLAGMYKPVGPTEVGVPVSFGTVGDPVGPGANWLAPWTDVETYPIRPVTVELAGDEKIVARTADAGQMGVEVAARWKVDPAKAKELYMQVRTGDDDRISQDIVVKNLRQAVGQVYSVTGNLDALNDRTKTTEAIKQQLDEQLTKYGIVIEDVNLRSVEPDEKTANTIALYASQQQATRIAEEAKKTATIEAQRRLIEAQGLESAARAVSGISQEEAAVLCIQVWQQTVTNSNTPVYTSPCAGVQPSIIVNSGTGASAQ